MYSPKIVNVFWHWSFIGYTLDNYRRLENGEC